MSRSHNHTANPITILTRTIRSLIILACEVTMGLVVLVCLIAMMLHAIFS